MIMEFSEMKKRGADSTQNVGKKSIDDIYGL